RRVAIGLLHEGRVMLLVAFPEAIQLAREAKAMRDLGCEDAMNLDGGESAALALDHRVWLRPQARLTNVIVLHPVG
ncbi:MAG: phosphodiester glycosidase family protein, partial [Cyanobacteria bacterium REEB65]|nr:phosphodiester glycosidase family protein [Cyanobacteria bacterium REEB65]